jgi:hypothetical protein
LNNNNWVEFNNLALSSSSSSSSEKLRFRTTGFDNDIDVDASNSSDSSISEASACDSADSTDSSTAISEGARDSATLDSADFANVISGGTSADDFISEVGTRDSIDTITSLVGTCVANFTLDVIDLVGGFIDVSTSVVDARALNLDAGTTLYCEGGLNSLISLLPDLPLVELEFAASAG